MGIKNKFKKLRERMVETQIASRGVKDKNVLDAMKKVPRHLFVPDDMKSHAYSDEPLPIGEGQTISQPYIVAYMTEALKLSKGKKVLEVGTGSGYQAAILAEIVGEIYSVELVEFLSYRAQDVLSEMGYKNIHFKIGDGSFGWEEFAPFDAIMVTAAPSKIPKALKQQLKINGEMIIPVGDTFQELVLITREEDGYRKKKLLPVRFVPLISTH